MKPDKDRPRTWIKFRDGLCENCFGGCCTMPVEIKSEDLVRLELCGQEEIEQSPKKVAKRLIKEGVLSSYREGTGLFMLTQRPNDDCFFLDSRSRLCTVYQKRPGVCREFPNIGPKPGFCPATKKEKG